MKEFRFRIAVIVGVLALSIFLLWPTYADYVTNQEIAEEISVVRDSIKNANPQISDSELEKVLELKEETIRVSDPSIRENREKRVKLGLDLQGGMYLVMEVNTAKLIEKIAKNPDDDFKAILKEAEKESKLTDENLVTLLAEKISAKGKRLSRYFGTIRDEDSEIISKLEKQEADAVTRAIEIISNRVNQYGVSEPSIQQQGSRRIIVELPGIAKEEEAKRLLQGTALLEFKFVKESDFTVPILTRIDEVVATVLNGPKAEEEKTDSLQEEMTAEKFAKDHPFFAIAQVNPQSPFADAFVKETDKAKVMSYLNMPEVKNVVPDNVEFVFSAKPEAIQDGINFFKLYLVNKVPELTGEVIVDASANIDPSTTEPVVYMSMNREGSKEWARITGANIKKRCAIILDNAIYSAPTIQNKIPGGRSSITGMADMAEAKLLSIVLKAGALPAPVDIIEERTVGPSLGQDSINQGFNSTIIGFLVVALFMIVYYKKVGTVADLGLFFTLIFLMGILAGFQATLTLPGIAGILLTIGMAVDANVLIYERIREELSTGKTVKAAIQSGFAQSYSAILDSNITTFFTGIILYQFGSGPVQGFALTLMIGIICSLFAALVLTKLVLEMMSANGNKINIG